MHSPEPWAPFGRQVIDANQHIIAQCGNEANPSRIAACVNACQGIPDINGTITMIADMKVAILTGDQELLEIIRRRLVELDAMPTRVKYLSVPEALKQKETEYQQALYGDSHQKPL